MKTEDLKDTSLFPPGGTYRLCENLLKTSFSNLSEENVMVFKDRLLDMTGCILGGDIVPEDRFFYDMLKRQGGEAAAPIFADSCHIRLPLASAVMHNCLHARANDYGSMEMVVFGEPIASHYGETILPMNLTLADVFGCSGEEFIANNIAAEDVVGRILYTLPIRWPTDMELGSTAAAAIAIRYYGLDISQAVTAFSYAATNASDPGNSYYDYCQEFKYHNAESARCGIMAAELAKGGWRGLRDPFFGNAGLISKKVPSGTLPDLYEKAFDRLGEVYFTEMRFKRGPGGMPTIVTAQIGAMLREQIISAYGNFDGEKVKRVVILEPDHLRRNYYSNPFSRGDQINALFSYAFACCCALYYGKRRIADIQTKAIQASPLLTAMVQNTVMDTYTSSHSEPVYKGRVEMEDGHIFEAEADFIKEMFYYPSKEFLLEKFWDQFHAFGRLPDAVGKKIIEMADRIETVKDMREYTELLTVPEN